MLTLSEHDAIAAVAGKLQSIQLGAHKLFAHAVMRDVLLLSDQAIEDFALGRCPRAKGEQIEAAKNVWPTICHLILRQLHA